MFSGHSVPTRKSVGTSALVFIFATTVTAESVSYRPNSRSTAGPLLITETSVLWRFSGGSYPYDNEHLTDDESRPYAAFDFGALENSGTGQSIGGSAFIAVSSDTWRIGLRPRVRLWTSERGHVDIAPGVILLAGNSKSQVSKPGFSGLITYGPNRWISAGVGVDVLRHKADPYYQNVTTKKTWTDTSVYAGLKLESYAGFIGPLAGVAVLITAAIAFG